MKKNTNYYIDKAKFYQEIVKWKNECAEAVKNNKEKPRLSNYIGKCIYDIANNTSLAPNFINYSFRTELVGDAIETCIKYFDSYDINDPSKNPFGYFTMVCWRAFVSRIGEEEKNRYMLYKSFERNMINSGGIDMLVDDDNNLINPEMYDNISEFIRNYEEKMEKKKQKKLQKKKEQEELDIKNGREKEGSDNSGTSGVLDPVS